MRVLMVTRYPLPGDGPFGGVEAAAVALVSGLRESPDVDLRLMVLRPDIEGRMETRQDGLSVTYVAHRPRAAAFGRYRDARRMLADEIGRWRPDCIHAQGVEAEGYAASRVPRIPIVLTPHGNLWKDETLNRSTLRTGMRGWARQLLAIKAIERADCVISVGGASTNHAERGRRVVSIPNAVRPDFFSPTASPPEGAHRVLVPGNIKRIKGIEHVLAAAARAGEICGAEVDVRVAGRVEDQAYWEQLQTMTTSLTRVSLSAVDARDAGTMMREYDEASVVALGSRWEVAPIVIGEAMARGRAVVAPSLPGIRAMTGDGSVAALYPACDVDALTRRLVECLEPGFAGELGGRARALALSGLHPQAVAAATISVYRALVGAIPAGDVTIGAEEAEASG